MTRISAATDLVTVTNTTIFPAADGLGGSGKYRVSATELKTYIGTGATGVPGATGLTGATGSPGGATGATGVPGSAVTAADIQALDLSATSTTDPGSGKIWLNNHFLMVGTPA